MLTNADFADTLRQMDETWFPVIPKDIVGIIAGYVPPRNVKLTMTSNTTVECQSVFDYLRIMAVAKDAADITTYVVHMNDDKYRDNRYKIVLPGVRDYRVQSDHAFSNIFGNAKRIYNSPIGETDMKKLGGIPLYVKNKLIDTSHTIVHGYGKTMVKNIATREKVLQIDHLVYEIVKCGDYFVTISNFIESVFSVYDTSNRLLITGSVSDLVGIKNVTAHMYGSHNSVAFVFLESMQHSGVVKTQCAMFDITSW